MGRKRSERIERPLKTAMEPEFAVLVGAETPGSNWPVDVSLAELGRLAETAGALVKAQVSQRLDKPNPRTFIGSGKVNEIKQLVGSLGLDVVIFDDELTPSQQSKLEEEFKPAKVIDRTALILDIFGLHAKTSEGKLQVQLAQLEYLYPRLRGMWSHLVGEQTRGGIGSRFGQGESQLEVDRRLIRKRIAKLKSDLKRLETSRDTQRKTRWESHAFKIALAGYTNAGKSTLLNALTGSDSLADDMLFATLDPTTRTLRLPEGRIVTITDTVGFIQKLPTTLVESFKSTLSEVIGADLIMIVCDASSPESDAQQETVERILEQIGATAAPRMVVYNKVDLLDEEEQDAIARRHPQSIMVSALTGKGISHLVNQIERLSAMGDRTMDLLIPFDQGDLVALAHERCRVLSEDYVAHGTRIVAQIPKELIELFAPYESGERLTYFDK